MKTCWYGESQKLVKGVFAKYERLCKKAKNLPILLFNEADAIFGKRLENKGSSVDQTEHDVDVIVSERGVADLRGLSPKERALVIIDKIANPKYQPMLLDYFHRACEACKNSQTPHILSEAFSFHTRFNETGTMEK